jgi:hypothetical protein
MLLTRGWQMIEIAAGSSELPAANAADGDLPHVLLVVDQFSKTLGGAERIILRLGDFARPS